MNSKEEYLEKHFQNGKVRISKKNNYFSIEQQEHWNKLSNKLSQNSEN